MTCAICRVGDTTPGCVTVTLLPESTVPGGMAGAGGCTMRAGASWGARRVDGPGPGRWSRLRHPVLRRRRDDAADRSEDDGLLPGSLSGSCHLDPTQYRAFVQLGGREESG